MQEEDDAAQNGSAPEHGGRDSSDETSTRSARESDPPEETEDNETPLCEFCQQETEVLDGAEAIYACATCFHLQA